MSNVYETLERLARLLDEGKLTRDEFDSLKREIMSTPDSAAMHVGSHEPGARETTQPRTGESGAPMDGGLVPQIYKWAFGLGLASVFLGGTFGLLAWATVALSGWALYSTRSKRGRWMAWVGLALGLVFSLMNIYLNSMAFWHRQLVSSLQ